VQFFTKATSFDLGGAQMTESSRNERLVEIIKAAVLHRLPTPWCDLVGGEWIGKVVANGKATTKEAWAEDCARNAVQAMQGLLGSCPRCSATLPQYTGLCCDCARAPDHEEG
jgi:hypothetical protein